MHIQSLCAPPCTQACVLVDSMPWLLHLQISYLLALGTRVITEHRQGRAGLAAVRHESVSPASMKSSEDEALMTLSAVSCLVPLAHLGHGASVNKTQ